MASGEHAQLPAVSTNNFPKYLKQSHPHEAEVFEAVRPQRGLGRRHVPYPFSGPPMTQHTGCRGCDIECLVEGFMVIQTSL